MLKCGIIGCGVIAPTHIEGFQAIPEIEVTCLCDLEIAKAEADNGEYEIVDDGQPEPEAQATTDDVLNALLGVM